MGPRSYKLLPGHLRNDWTWFADKATNSSVFIFKKNEEVSVFSKAKLK